MINICFEGADRGWLTNIYIWNTHRHSPKQHLLQFKENGVREWVEFGEEDFNSTEKLRPSISLQNEIAEEFLLACAKEFHRQGKRLPDEQKLEGLYEAQGKHLKDLRHLLKLPKEKTDER